MLSNKLALITGGASGIGLAIGKLFAKNGAHVALADMSPSLSSVASDISKLSKNKVTAHTCDVSNSDQVNSLFNELEQQHPDYKFPRIVVNSAGIIRDGYMAKLTEADFDKVINVNLKGTFLVTQAASRKLIANYPNYEESDNPHATFASIINISSIIGKYGAIGQANYSASKAGVDAFTKTCSKELGKFKVRCNTIQPGFIQTPMTSHLNENQLGMMLMLMSIKRLGTPEDIAQTALFLASDNSSFITGTAIECNGGLVI